MMVLSLTDILLCLAVVVLIGAGGFYIGHQRGYDIGERDHRAWCTRHHMTRPAAAELAAPGPFISANDGVQIEREMMSTRPGGYLDALTLHAAMDGVWNAPAFQGAQDPAYGLPGRHAAREPDTAPLRALVTRAAGAFHRQAAAPVLGGCLPLDELDIDVVQMIERNELEVRQLIRRAELTIGGFTHGQEIQG